MTDDGIGRKTGDGGPALSSVLCLPSPVSLVLRLSPERLAGCSLRRDRVLWVVFVPFGDQFLAGLANVLAVDDLAAENTRDVEPVTEGRVSPVLDVERAIQPDGGRPGAQPFHLDRAPAAAVFDELVAEFLHGLVHRAFNQACGARERADELGLLNGVPLFDPRTVGIDRLYFMCHLNLRKDGFCLPNMRSVGTRYSSHLV